MLEDNALLQYAQVNRLATPTTENLKNLRKWLERPGYGAGFLDGSPEDAWDVSKGHNDFISLSRVDTEQDSLTRWVLKYLPLWFRNLTARKYSPTKVYSFNETGLARAADGLSTVVSSILPTLSILILHYIHNINVRLGLVLVFNVIFATTLFLVSKSRRIEVFAATAA